jgi:hypothetical protein
VSKAGGESVPRAMGVIFVGVFVTMMLVFQISKRGAGNSKPKGTRSTNAAPAKSVVPAPVMEETPGDKMLESYASTETTPKEDLQWVQRLLNNALIVVKRADTRHYATNEDLANFLRGANPDQQVIVSSNSPIFGTDGRVVDRWGSPLIVHPIKSDRLELRSAGPDRKPWTDDDIIVDSTDG